jgi:exopolysaccharide biosynthesis polyprenyl glycosylphosphotransferase
VAGSFHVLRRGRHIATSVPNQKTSSPATPTGALSPFRESVSGPAGTRGPRTETPLDVRLALQQRAAKNFRRHLVRGVRRVGVLVLADLVAFQLMRTVFRAIRNHAAVGGDVASVLQNRLPSGYLGGWQFAAALILGMYVTGNYNHGDDRRDPRRLFAGCALAVALPLWMPLWNEGPGIVLLQYSLTVLLVWAGIVAERLMLDKVVAVISPQGPRAARTVFVGNASDCRAAARNPAIVESGEFRVKGFVDLHTPPASDAVGSIMEFPRILHETGAEVVVACGFLPDHQLQDVAESALSAGCQVLSIPRSISIAGLQPSVVWRQGHPLMELTAPSLKGQQLVLKRMVDLIGASLGLLLAAPVMLLTALLIKLDSKGPVFFRQERIGTGGRPFQVWKFRTMQSGASDAAHRELVTRMLGGEESGTGHTGVDGKPVYKLVNDSRVTRIGGFLRRTSIDEIPQLFNVLKGDMSLVGPRPPVPYEFEAYDHWQYDRLQVRPGITGLWQVSGRNLLTYRQMCELDVEYVRDWSLYLDFKILFKTIPVVLFNSGKAA